MAKSRSPHELCIERIEKGVTELLSLASPKPEPETEESLIFPIPILRQLNNYIVKQNKIDLLAQAINIFEESVIVPPDQLKKAIGTLNSFLRSSEITSIIIALASLIEALKVQQFVHAMKVIEWPDISEASQIIMETPIVIINRARPHEPVPAVLRRIYKCKVNQAVRNRLDEAKQALSEPEPVSGILKAYPL